ncbi:MAG: hypothetical protein OES13_06890, partial [Acidimicrobiia bacterium]|nr:hypothetical protein [Acidimicrobiia bacterium]
GGLGAAEYSFGFGNPGDKPVVGDWDGDGIDEIGLHRESSGFFYYRNTLTTGNADGQFFFGDPGDRFVAGDWGVVDRMATPAVFRPGNSTFYFRHTMTEGNADASMAWGRSGFMPVSGNFGVLPGGGGLPVTPPPPPPPGSHPASGDGWQLLACDSLVETSIYRTSDECVRIRVQKWKLPIVGTVRWVGPSPFGSVSEHYNYDGGVLVSIDFMTQIAAAGLGAGDYRADFQNVLSEVLFTVHFTIIN